MVRLFPLLATVLALALPVRAEDDWTPCKDKAQLKACEDAEKAGCFVNKKSIVCCAPEKDAARCDNDALATLKPGGKLKADDHVWLWLKAALSRPGAKK